MSDTTLDPEILAGFLDEGHRCISLLNEHLLEVERGETSADRIGAMFRAAHSLKGLSSMLHLQAFGCVTHALETVLDHVRSGKCVFTQGMVATLFDSFDVLTNLHAGIAQGDMVGPDVSDMVARLKKTLVSVTEECTDDICELGLLPECLQGKLDIDDILEGLVAIRNGGYVYALQFDLRDIFSRQIRLDALLGRLRNRVKVQRLLCAYGPTDSICRPLCDYGAHLVLLVCTNEPLRPLLSHMALVPCVFWELGHEGPLTMERFDGTPDTGDEPSLSIRPDMGHLLQPWLADTREELDSLDSLLLVWEKDRDTHDLIGDVFRMFHRIKGSSATMGFTAITMVAHVAESLLARLRDEACPLDEECFPAFFATRDYLSTCLQRVASQSSDVPSADELMRLLKRLIARTEVGDAPLNIAEQTAAARLAEAGHVIWRIRIVIGPRAPLADLRCRLILRNLESLGDVIAASPDIQMLNEGLGPVTDLRVLMGSSHPEEALRKAVEIDHVYRTSWQRIVIEGTAKAATSNADRASRTGSDTVRVETARLDSLLNASGELVIAKAGLTRMAEEFGAALSGVDLRLLERLIARAQGDREFSSQMGDRLLRLEKWAHDLPRIQTGADDLRNAAIGLHRHVGVIQDAVMRIRMVPIGPLFQRYQRIVRDVAKTLGRHAALVVRGEHTELDKKLVDELADPLTHMVRNAVDHGLESAEERLRAGKPEQGTVTLDAFHEGGRICIRIRDDGRGLDAERIRDKAIERGLVEPGAAARLAPEEVFRFIFQPGFSTADTVTDISGRGVGMDIVNNKIAQLKGSVDVASTLGQGTVFTIRLPLTLAVIKTLLVRNGDGHYAFPLESVREIVDLPSSAIHTTDGGMRIATVRDEVIPIVELEQALSIGVSSGEKASWRCIVTRGAEGPLGVVVEHVFRQEEIVVKPLTEEFAGVKGISGATILGDGNVALILDVDMLAQQLRNRPGPIEGSCHHSSHASPVP